MASFHKSSTVSFTSFISACLEFSTCRHQIRVHPARNRIQPATINPRNILSFLFSFSTSTWLAKNAKYVFCVMKYYVRSFPPSFVGALTVVVAFSFCLYQDQLYVKNYSVREIYVRWRTPMPRDSPWS